MTFENLRIMGAEPLYQNRTVEEYLAFESESAEKHEYYRGEIFMMAGASINHNRVVSNSNVAFSGALQGQASETFVADLRIQVEAAGLFTYPDLTVLCDEPAFYKKRNDTITNPTVLIEVLSPSTKDYDQGQKFQFYRTLPSLKAYLTISSEDYRVVVFTKLGTDRWELVEYRGLDALINLPPLNISLQAAALYRNVEIGKESA